VTSSQPATVSAAAAIGDGAADVVLRVDDLVVHYPGSSARGLRRRRATVRAVDGVSFEIRRGETLALVGESGCGKSTIGRAILMLTPPTRGTITFIGRDLASLGAEELRSTRKHMQIIFQDPFASLDPRMRVGQIIREALDVHRIGRPADRSARVLELLQLVGLGLQAAPRFPHEFSGGQRQRIGIARALAAEPDFIVCDEPVSALDVSIQAQVLALLRRLQRTLGLTYLFISHDLAVVRNVADHVAVIYLGKIVEFADVASLYTTPRHPYTQALLGSVPSPDPDVERARLKVVLHGEIPSAANPPPGCHFHSRCPHAKQRCREVEPPLETTIGGHTVACHFWREIPIPPGLGGQAVPPASDR
jgi:oligopeptide/dipeptide ABC transporter ATP-binding protein